MQGSLNSALFFEKAPTQPNSLSPCESPGARQFFRSPLLGKRNSPEVTSAKHPLQLPEGIGHNPHVEGNGAEPVTHKAPLPVKRKSARMLTYDSLLKPGCFQKYRSQQSHGEKHPQPHEFGNLKNIQSPETRELQRKYNNARMAALKYAAAELQPSEICNKRNSIFSAGEKALDPRGSSYQSPIFFSKVPDSLEASPQTNYDFQRRFAQTKMGCDEPIWRQMDADCQMSPLSLKKARIGLLDISPPMALEKLGNRKGKGRGSAASLCSRKANLIFTKKEIQDLVAQKYEDLDFRPKLLPTSDSLKCYPEISAHTLAHTLASQNTNLLIIDCRFAAEYKGGRIQGALNFCSPFELQEYLLHSAKQAITRLLQDTAIVFHCEFSSKRAPAMYRMMREVDRMLVGMADYPKVLLPQTYVLQGGYSQFYAEYPELCEGPGYLRMTQVADCDQSMSRFEEESRQYTADLKKMF